MPRLTPIVLLTGIAFGVAPLAAQVPTLANVAYGPHARNVLDVYQPVSTNPTPVVIYIHGGGFTSGDKSQAEGSSDARQFLQAGVTLIAINYRYLSNPNVPLQDVLRDCARAVQFVRSKAAEWNLNPYRVAAYGSSAGGGTSLWLATHPDWADPENSDPVLRQSSKVVCAGTISGQFSYDVERWRDEFGNSTVTTFGSGYTSPGIYGFATRDELFTPAGAAIRASLDMHGMISASTPPVFVTASQTATTITSTSLLLHHPRHAQLVYDRCVEFGVPAVPTIPAYAMAPAAGDPTTWVGFALKYLTQPAPGEFLMTFDALPDAIFGREFPATQLTAAGGQAPYTWSVAGGSLPPGLEVSAAGIMTGLPTELGTFPVTLRVEDSTGTAVQWVYSQAVVPADQAGLLVREDFEAHPIGQAAPATWSNQATVIDAGAAFNGGKALEIRDASSSNAGYEINLSPDAAGELSRLHIRFEIRNLDPEQAVNGALHFSLGRFSTSTSATLNANANRSFGLEFNRTGALNLRINGAVQAAAFTTYDRSAIHAVEVFVNDHETEAVDYLRPDTGGGASLGANQVVVFVNGLYHSTATLHAPGGAGDATLGRLGFYCGTTDQIHMAVDNLMVGAIAAPPSEVAFGWEEVALDEASLTLAVSLPAGSSYQLERSSTPAAAGQWEAVGEPVGAPTGGGVYTFTLAPDDTAAERFYRVRRLVP